MEVNTEVLTDYLNNKCNAKTKQEVENWKAQNLDNLNYFNEIKFYWENKNILSTNIYFDPEIGFKKLLKKRTQKRNIAIRKTLQYAAMFAIIITTCILGYQSTNTKSHNKAELVFNSEKTEKQILLSDGTSILLAQGATIEYPDEFSKTDRLVKLTGEAFFKVAKDKNKPFVILTENTRTKVLGTSFRISENTGRTNIEVKTGIVEFMELKNPENKIKLEKDQMAQFVNQQKVVLSGNAGFENKILCVKLLKYKNEKLENICNDLNELFETNIKLEGENTSQLSLTAVFEDQNLDSILKSICFTLNLEIIRKENYILLK